MLKWLKQAYHFYLVSMLWISMECKRALFKTISFVQLKNLSIRVVRNHGHVYFEWTPKHTILCTKSKLIKLNRGFHHPSSDKLYNLVKRARPQQLSPETTRILDNIVQPWGACEGCGPCPVGFKVCIRSEDEIVFDNEVSMDLMFI